MEVCVRRARGAARGVNCTPNALPSGLGTNRPAHGRLAALWTAGRSRCVQAGDLGGPTRPQNACIVSCVTREHDPGPHETHSRPELCGRSAARSPSRRRAVQLHPLLQ